MTVFVKNIVINKYNITAYSFINPLKNNQFAVIEYHNSPINVSTINALRKTLQARLFTAITYKQNTFHNNKKNTCTYTLFKTYHYILSCLPLLFQFSVFNYLLN